LYEEEKQMIKKKRIGWLMLALVLAVPAIGINIGTVQHPLPAQGAGVPAIPRVFAMVPEWSGFVDTDKWGFGAVLITASPEALEARFIGAQIGDRFVTSVVENEWTEVTRVGQGIERALGRYKELHNLRVQRQAQRAGRWSEDFAQRIDEEYYSIRQQIYSRFVQLAEAGKRTDGILARIPSMTVALGETVIVELIFEVWRAHDPTARHRITVPTSVTKLPPLEVEDGSVWIPGDLHIHSIYSDGNYNLYQLRDTNPGGGGMRGLGYRFVYMTDHVGQHSGEFLHRSQCLCPDPAVTGFARCNSASTWNCYVTNTQRVTTSEIAFFPGAEYRTVDAPFPQVGGGHATIFGLNNLIRGDAHQWLIDYQLTGPQLVNARPSGSNLAIAHPVHATIGWSWPIHHYRGAETMAPHPGDELGWWRNRAFTTEALNDAVNLGVVLSVRTGSDFSGALPFYQCYTFVHIPVSFSQWQSEAWATRRQRVNTALVQGRTVASRHGGFARLAVNGNLPGTVLRNIPANTNLNLAIMLHPARSGVYELRIYRNNNNLVWSHTVSATAGHITHYSASTVFPEGTSGYWLHVREVMHGLDIIYSTPVIVTSQL
jgi:hypothetical protein